MIGEREQRRAGPRSGLADGDDRCAEERERHQRDGRCGNVTDEDPPSIVRHAVGLVRVVDLLRQRLEGVEPEQVQRHGHH